MKMTDRFAACFGVLLVILALSGGFYFQGHGWAFEISQLDPFGVLLLLCLLIMTWKQGTSNFSSGTGFGTRALTLLERPTSKWLLRGMLFVFGFLFLGHWMRHASFETHVFDMNCLHQPLFYPFEEVLFHCNTCRMNTQFAEHMVWTLIPLSLITMLLKSDVLIFVVQSLVVAVPLWIFITRGPLRAERLHGFWFFVLFALMKPLRDGMIFDFREDAVGFGLLLLAFTAFDHRRWIWGITLTFLVMASKENFPVVTALMGIVLLADRHLPLSSRQRWISGTATIVLSLLVFRIYNQVLIPKYMGPSESLNNVLRYFPGMGNTMNEFVYNALTHPWDFLTRFGPRFLTGQGLKYVAMILAPLAIWGWRDRAWIWTLPGLAMAALNVLSTQNNQSSGSFHYDFIVIPFLMMAVSLGIRSASRTRSFYELRSVWVWALVIAACVASRGPVFEVTHRLARYWDRIPAHLAVKTWKIGPGPLAANAFDLSQFNRVKELRWLRVAGGAVPEDRAEFARQMLLANPVIPITEQQRDIGDAIHFVVRLDDPWEKAVYDEALRAGGVVKGLAPRAGGEPFIAWVQTPEPLLAIWCRDLSVCRQSSNQGL